MMKKLTQNKLKELLHYDPGTGVFTWLIQASKNVHVGDLAGCLDRYNGYARICFCGVSYLAHRLAWLYMTGKWPEEGIDHRNGIRSDNRWENLREASGSLNQQNRRKANKNSTTGLIGVQRARKGFAAQIWLAGKRRCIGIYPTPELAHKAYLKVKRDIHLGCTI